jgi:hypothetical protein
MKYFLICDHNNHVIAIHKTFDSAYICYRMRSVKGDFKVVLTLTIVDTDDYGVVVSEIILHTYFN